MARRTHALPGAHAIRIDPGGYTCCPKLSADFCGHPQVRSGQVRSDLVRSRQVRSGQVRLAHSGFAMRYRICTM